MAAVARFGHISPLLVVQATSIGLTSTDWKDEKERHESIHTG